jgi:hypothetical protein
MTDDDVAGTALRPFQPSPQPHQVNSDNAPLFTAFTPTGAYTSRLLIDRLVNTRRLDMQLTTLLLAGLSAVSVSALPSASWVPNQVTVQEEFKVPGDNPLYFCGDPADDILKIEKADLDPNPPKPYVHPRVEQQLWLALQEACMRYKT